MRHGMKELQSAVNQKREMTLHPGAGAVGDLDIEDGDVLLAEKQRF